MSNIEVVRAKVAELYQRQDPNRDEWADWLYENHVLWVAEKSRELAEKYDADADLAEAAALLHDIADSVMPRKSEEHESESLRIAREIAGYAGYGTEHVALIVDDAITFHSCHNGERPKSTEGLALAMADALAHFQTSFYAFALYHNGRDYEDALAWARAKIDRDYHEKIQFDAEREEARSAYETFKRLFA